MKFNFQHSLPSAPHTSPIVVAVVDPIDEEVFILLVKAVINNIYDIIISVSQPSVFHDNQMGPKQENKEVDQPVQSHRHVERALKPRICVLEH